MSTRQFYDDLAVYYDLVFENWDASMARQGAALEQAIRAELGASAGAPPIRLLDAACGIGTQSLPLAQRGFDVTGRDLSPAAIARLRREADARGIRIDTAVGDMRQVAAGAAGAAGSFDVVLCADNSMPHLLNDADILTALRAFRSVLRPGGLCICSVRDYDALPRGENTTLDYGARCRGDQEFRLRQEWTWDGPTHYQLDFIVERNGPDGAAVLVRAVTRYYAIGITRLLELMTEAGFSAARRVDGAFYQPLLLARA